jgi:hypothetical protein
VKEAEVHGLDEEEIWLRELQELGQDHQANKES